MTDHIADDGRKVFTVVFEGDLRAFEGNPFHVDTPFGRPYACGPGNMFEREDEAVETITEMERALRAIRSAWPVGTNSPHQADALVLVNKAIARAESY
ncbi:MAG: hypothetical protein EON87_16085 [Brevundimonas sp.]|nr:MAG: hypothetical protein EON87_16085 [Brevundimonas sp.]